MLLRNWLGLRDRDSVYCLRWIHKNPVHLDDRHIPMYTSHGGNWVNCLLQIRTKTIKHEWLESRYNHDNFNEYQRHKLTSDRIKYQNRHILTILGMVSNQSRSFLSIPSFGVHHQFLFQSFE